MHEKGIESMNPRQIENFVNDHVIEFTQERQNELETFTADSLRCIDDRASEVGNLRDEELAIPGAGLGVLMDVLAGLNIENLSKELSPKEAALIIEELIGPPSFHTDEDHEGESLACAGCGHCAGAMKDPKKYLLSHEAVAFLPSYIRELGSRVEPAVYRGKHEAKAIVIVDSFSHGLPTTDGESRVYVFHRAWHRRILDELATRIANQIIANDESLRSRGESFRRQLNRSLSESFWKAAEERLQATIKHLAPTLPVYVVSHTGERIEISRT
jgi:hypothetical protein